MVLPRLILRTTQIIGPKLSKNIKLVNHNIRFINTTSWLSAERKYSDKHEWVEIDGKIGTVGISQYAQEALGDVVFAQLPDVGTVLKQEDECGALESVKAATEIYSPVSGKVVQKNSSVEDTPSLINSSCYEKGWLFKVKMAEDSGMNKLMDEKQYETFLKTAEQHH